MTKQRELMLSIFHSDFCHGMHRTADEILARAREIMPSISRATVYNNLKEMAKEGIIRKISGDDGPDRYDNSFIPHAHLLCTFCGGVSDIDIPGIKQILDESIGTEAESFEIKVRGCCESCRSSACE